MMGRRMQRTWNRALRAQRRGRIGAVGGKVTRLLQYGVILASRGHVHQLGRDVLALLHGAAEHGVRAQHLRRVGKALEQGPVSGDSALLGHGQAVGDGEELVSIHNGRGQHAPELVAQLERLIVRYARGLHVLAHLHLGDH